MKLALFGVVICVAFSATAHAEDVLSYLTDKNGKYIGPTVEENVVKMDTDKNGFADVDEVRAFLQLKHGKDYEKDVLDQWLVASKGHSCGTNFAKDLAN
jgi:hypothetical protein